MPVEKTQMQQASDIGALVPPQFPKLPEAPLKRFPELKAWQEEVDAWYRKLRRGLVVNSDEESFLTAANTEELTKLVTKVKDETNRSLASYKQIIEANATDTDALTQKTEELEATVDTGFAEITAAITNIETTYATKEYAEASSGQALTAAAADATAKVNGEAAVRASADQALSERTSALEASVGGSTELVSRIENIETTYATKDYAETKKSEAITAAAGDATSKVSAESSARAQADGFLASKYTLKVGSGNVITGFNITSSTGNGQDVSEVAWNADVFKISNGSGKVTPFIVKDGAVYINVAMIRNASITSAMINDLVADKVSAGTLNAMTLLASKTATSSAAFHVDNPNSTFPIFCARRGFHGDKHDINGSEYIHLLSIYGWSTGSGFAHDRFGKTNMVFSVNVKGAFNITDRGFGLSHADIRGVFRVNGGGWVGATDSSRATTYNGGATVSDTVEVNGLGGGDVIDFGVLVETPALQNYGYSVMTVNYGNL